MGRSPEASGVWSWSWLWRHMGARIVHELTSGNGFCSLSFFKFDESLSGGHSGGNSMGPSMATVLHGKPGHVETTVAEVRLSDSQLIRSQGNGFAGLASGLCVQQRRCFRWWQCCLRGLLAYQLSIGQMVPRFDLRFYPLCFYCCCGAFWEAERRENS